MTHRAGAGRRVLVDPELDRRLAADGYVVLPIADAARAAVARQRFGDLHGWRRLAHFDDQPHDFENDFWNADLAYRSAVDDVIGDLTGSTLPASFVSHRPIGRAFIVKWPSDGTAPRRGVPDAFHNDTMFVDERFGDRSYIVWTALEDVAGRNGGLWIVPGSHRVRRDVRGIDFGSTWTSHDDVLGRFAIRLDLRCGDAVIFDPATVHRSDPNTGDTPRVVASTLMAPPDCEVSFFRRLDDTRAEKVVVRRDFFVATTLDEMERLPASETIEIDDAPLTAAELETRLAQLAAVAPTSRRWRRQRGRRAGDTRA